MFWRKWMVRGLVFTIFGACASAAVIYQRWTDPAVVREQVINKLQAMYPGATITIDKARLRILGGIMLSELRMCRRDDPSGAEFFHVPSAIIYHDKEKISQGLITIRKIELYRPRLHAVRDRDGSWNLQKIMGDRPQAALIPTVVVHQGTIQIEDRPSNLPATLLEIGDVNLSFINDPLNLVTIAGSAKSPALGNVELKGIIHRDTQKVVLETKAKNMLLSSGLLQRIPILGCDPRLAEVDLEARADLDASLVYRPDQPLEYKVSVRVSHGKLRHPKLPLPLEDMHASLSCTNGQVRIADFEARSKQTIVKGFGTAQLPAVDENFEVDLDIKHLAMDKDLIERLPEKLHSLQQLFQAGGLFSVRLTCAQQDGNWANLSSGGRSRLTLLPEDGQACFKNFQYPLEKITGIIDWQPHDHTILTDVIGYSHNRPVPIVGSWQGAGLEVASKFDIKSEGVPIDPQLIGALSARFQHFTNSFHPTGKIDFQAHLSRHPGSNDFHNEYHINLREGSVCWDGFPYPLENVNGILDIYPDRWEFKGHGSHGQGEMAIEGRSVPGSTNQLLSDDDGLFLKIEGRNLPLDEDMNKATAPMPQMAKVWESFRLRGRLNFNAYVQRGIGPQHEMDVVVDMLGGGTMEPVFFPYPMSDLCGRFHLHNNRLEISQFRARHDSTRLEIDQGTVDLRAGGYYVDLSELRIEQLNSDEAFLRALPKPLKSGLRLLQLKNPVDIKTRLVISQRPEPGSPPDVFWDGGVRLTNAQFTAGVTYDGVDGIIACRGRYDGRQMQGLRGNYAFEHASVLKQLFEKVHGKLWIEENSPDILNLDLNAPIFGGIVTGRSQIEFTSSLRYALRLDATGISLQQAGKHNLGRRSPQLEGKMDASFFLTGLGSNANTLDGNGCIDVPQGRIYNLPFLSDLLRFLGLREPDTAAFEELHSLFSIHGTRASVRRFELIGSAITLSGTGDFNIDGTNLNLNLYPSLGRLKQITHPIFQPIAEAFSKNLMLIEIRGQIDSHPDHLKFNKKLLPIITDPLIDIRNRIIGPPAKREP